MVSFRSSPISLGTQNLSIIPTFQVRRRVRMERGWQRGHGGCPRRGTWGRWGCHGRSIPLPTSDHRTRRWSSLSTLKPTETVWRSRTIEAGHDRQRYLKPRFSPSLLLPPLLLFGIPCPELSAETTLLHARPATVSSRVWCIDIWIVLSCWFQIDFAWSVV